MNIDFTENKSGLLTSAERDALQDLQLYAYRPIRGQGVSDVPSGVTISGPPPAAALPKNAIFPVRVVQVGGANGNDTTQASYTYDVYNLGSVRIGAGVYLSRYRDNGVVIVHGGSTGTAGYGAAFYDGTRLRLWDANETYLTGTCGTA